MDPLKALEGALGGGLLGPALGAVIVIVAWALSHLRGDVPIGEQLAHAGRAIWPVLPWALAAGGTVLLGGQRWQVALTATIGALLTAAGFRAPTRPQ